MSHEVYFLEMQSWPSVRSSFWTNSGHFSELEDPRSSISIRHPLPSALIITLLALLPGRADPAAVRLWAEARPEFMQTCFPHPSSIRSAAVFRRALKALNSVAFQQCFLAWPIELNPATASESEAPSEKSVLARDGKTLLRSFDRNYQLGTLQRISVQMVQAGITLT